MEITMTEELKLCNIKAGECASVVCILPSCPIQRRLLDIGLIHGTQVKCLYASIGKNMKAYSIRGATIAIRDEDCAHVIVERSTNENQ
jgi:ferrous iron transport protein A